MTSPMTISLEEHVARAIATSKRGIDSSDPIIDRVWSSYVGMARAAIAAVREYEVPGGVGRPSDLATTLTFHPMMDDPLDLAHWVDGHITAYRASIRESERAACEAIAREEENGSGGEHGIAKAIGDKIASRKGKGEGKKP